MRGLLFSVSFFFYFFPEKAKLVKINTLLCGLLGPLTTLTNGSIFQNAGVLDLHLVCIYNMLACYNKIFDQIEAALKMSSLKKVLLKCPQIA